MKLLQEDIRELARLTTLPLDEFQREVARIEPRVREDFTREQWEALQLEAKQIFSI